LTDWLARDATDQLRGLAAQRVRARDLLELSLARADATHAALNAVVVRDVEAARRRADAADADLAAGRPIGRLAGLPMTVKDTLDVESMPASAGLAAILKRNAGDAASVARVLGEGAVIWGKTNVPVMAGDWQSYNKLYGPTNNPWDLELTPGGSSGGAAAALSAGVTALEIGSDIGGSLRIPASFTGVFSHKPTWCLVPQAGHVPPLPGRLNEPDLNVVGPMARSARDLRLLLSILAEGFVPPEAPPVDLEGLRVAVWLQDPNLVLDAEVAAAMAAWIERLAAEGAKLELVKSPVDMSALLEAYVVLLMSLHGGDLPAARLRGMRLARGPAKLSRRFGAGPLSKAAFTLGYTASHAEWLEAHEVRLTAGRTMATFFERYDVLVAPISPVAPFPHDHRPFWRRKLTCSDGQRIAYDSLLHWIALATACGLPSTAVPAGLTTTGKPVGVQLIGPRLGDSRMLAIAESIDERIGGYVPPPLLADL
jgi:amidase